jgi:hypothetical protein
MSPGAITIMRPLGDSTVIGTESDGNSNAHTSPSLPRSDRKRICSMSGTRRNAEVRLMSAESLPPVMFVGGWSWFSSMRRYSPSMSDCFWRAPVAGHHHLEGMAA